MTTAAGVQRLDDLYARALGHLLLPYGLNVEFVASDAVVPGSYWGDSEAGLIRDRLYVRADTPVHSALHEACHFICMNEERRNGLDRDAGGDYDEENAVCYLQILLADRLPGFGRLRMCHDMDAWGYTFRLGSAQAWFQCDADDAREWLQQRGLLDTHGHLPASSTAV